MINLLAVGTSPVPTGKPASYPPWWFEQDVIPRIDPIHDTSPSWTNGSYHSPDDYATANLGQLKYIATKAAAELDAHLHVPGGAGDDVHNLVAQWAAPPADGVVRDDYATLNLGQLKAVAKVFYDRLIAVRYTDAYPWDKAGLPADDWSMANLGQIKYLFSFDLTYSTLNDGLPDWWVLGWKLGSVTDSAVPDADPDGDGMSNLYEFTHGIDPTDYYNGQTVVLTLVSGGSQSGPPGNFLDQPIVVSVKRSDGTAWPAGAPVNFTADTGLGGYATINDGSQNPQSSLTVQVDANGLVQVYFQPAASITGSGYAAAGRAKLQFTASGYDPNSAPSTGPSLTSTSVSSTQTNLSWDSNATNSTGTTIQRWTYGTGWQTIGTTGAGTNSYADNSVPTGKVVAYRVISTNGQGSSPASGTQSTDGSDPSTRIATTTA